MGSSKRKHLSYANVAATLALIMAMSGGALAASHYLITSTKQISPKVLRKLKGRRGRTGATGPPGIPGTQGPLGIQGPKGVPGKDGAPGQSALSPLHSGQSVSGVYAIRRELAEKGELLDEAITYPIRLVAPLEVSNVIYTKPGEPGPEHCKAPGKADPGYLCIYSEFDEGVEPPAPLNPEEAGAGEPPKALKPGAGALGVVLQWKATGSTSAADDGTYTVTAP
jgi:Collagen triple helix repeat (20 copies)